MQTLKINSIIRKVLKGGRWGSLRRGGKGGLSEEEARLGHCLGCKNWSERVGHGWAVSRIISANHRLEDKRKGRGGKTMEERRGRKKGSPQSEEEDKGSFFRRKKSR